MSDASETRAPLEKLYDVAERQAGYFTTAQAREAGFTQPQLTYYTRSGRFLRVKWGIYRLALFPSTPHEDLFVAWLRAGPAAVISHDSALALYELSDALPDRIHVTAPRSAGDGSAGARVHPCIYYPQALALLSRAPHRQEVRYAHCSNPLARGPGALGMF